MIPSIFLFVFLIILLMIFVVSVLWRLRVIEQKLETKDRTNADIDALRREINNLRLLIPGATPPTDPRARMFDQDRIDRKSV